MRRCIVASWPDSNVVEIDVVLGKATPVVAVIPTAELVCPLKSSLIADVKH